MAASISSLSSLCTSFRRLLEQEDGVALVHLLDPSHIPGHLLLDESLIQDTSTREGGEVYGEILSLYLLGLNARASGQTLRELELACTCLKTWVQRYIEAEGTGLWMTPLMTFLSILARRVALQLDQAKRSEANSDAYLKKLVEIHRELFQKLNKERNKRAGHVWVCCELLRAYFRLGQISQCSFLLTAVSQSLSKDGFNPMDLPKSISVTPPPARLCSRVRPALLPTRSSEPPSAGTRQGLLQEIARAPTPSARPVTFSFYWGKHCVFDHNLRDADERLSWAFDHCPPKSKSNRRKILLYLVPCKLRLGVLPTQGLLQTYDLVMFIDIVRAIREGNVKLFTEKMEEHAADFIKMGTYLLMMKLKFMVLRNLCKSVHHEVRRRLGENAAHKLDLTPFEHVFAWQDDCDVDETACVLSNLIYQGAVKGYMSHEHRKLVFAKDLPFPPPSKWRM